MRYIITAFLLLCLVSPAAAEPKTPRRAMILVFDQMRAEYIDRFDLPNFKRAQRMGLNFDNGIVGHLESNTIISHPVITSGLRPGHFAWGSQIAKDMRGLVGPKGLFYMPARLSPDEWMAMQMEVVGDRSIVARVKEHHPGPTFAVAQKEYAAYNFGGPYTDSIICLGEILESGPYQGYHKVGGFQVPEYIEQPVGNRFYLEGSNDWGSTEERYSLHGSGYVPGVDPERPGGDRWVGDVVEQIMEREKDWSVLLASFGAIDKVSHVLAEHDGPTQAGWALKHDINLEKTLHLADKELGRILTRLEKQGLTEETVLVITADHGGQRNSSFHGRLGAPSHRDDSYYGGGMNFDFTSNPNPVFQPLISSGKLQAMSLDTVILLWSEALKPEERTRFLEDVSGLPGVAEVFSKSANGAYERTFRSERLKGRELAWAQAHNLALVNTLSGPGAPDHVATLFDNNGYGLIGAHGGAQELVQRIPYILISPNLARAGSRSKAWVRLVDVNPIIGEAMGLSEPSGLDGTSEALLPFLKRRR